LAAIVALSTLGLAGCALISSGSAIPGPVAGTATLLADGRVLLAGGYSGDHTPATASAELYDPKTDKFTSAGTMTVPRESHTATLLGDGQVLIAGGANATSGTPTDLTSAELYDPATGRFTPTGSMSKTNSGGMATILKDGRVLVLDLSGAADLYDPHTGTFSPTGRMADAHRWGSLTALADGRVLLVGGLGVQLQELSSAEIYDPATGAFSATGSMTSVRSGHTATLLLDGRVLIAGGEADYAHTLAYSELHDPVIGTFTPSGSMIEPRSNHVAVRLADGRVLLVGGTSADRGGIRPEDGRIQFDRFDDRGSLLACRHSPFRWPCVRCRGPEQLGYSDCFGRAVRPEDR
jgi:hypothetical protein